MACASNVAHQFVTCIQPAAINIVSNGNGNVGCDVACNGGNVAASAKSRVLVIGATGFIGRFVAEASVKSGFPTYALVRPATSRQKTVQALKDSGAHILNGCLEDYGSLVKAVRQVDVVISTVGGGQILDQLKIVDAIKEAGGTVKRFLPSEFGHDVDQADPHEPALGFYIEKRKIRRAVEEAMIPYTYICCNSIAGWPYYYHTHPTELPPPSDRFEIYGDGNVKAFFVTGEDIGAYTMRTVDDPRTLNKSVHFRPPKNFLTLNEMATIWENKIQKTLPRVVITEDDLLVIARANFMPSSIVAALTHDIFINGCQFKFPLGGPHDVEACELYPDLKYTTIEDFFTTYL
uniref:NmrA-like domain-containing protein n=1 Tax=Araucaria cunninghamii TaxID=56994 RepID=A0A0D6QZV1_ARACU